MLDGTDEVRRRGLEGPDTRAARCVRMNGVSGPAEGERVERVETLVAAAREADVFMRLAFSGAVGCVVSLWRDEVIQPPRDCVSAVPRRMMAEWKTRSRLAADVFSRWGTSWGRRSCMMVWASIDEIR